MTSLAHFEKLAGTIALPGLAVIDGKLGRERERRRPSTTSRRATAE